MLSQIDLTISFVLRKTAPAFSGLPSFAYQSHVNKQLAHLGGSCVNNWFGLFYKTLLTLCCGYFQYFPKEICSSYFMSCSNQSLHC